MNLPMIGIRKSRGRQLKPFLMIISALAQAQKYVSIRLYAIRRRVLLLHAIQCFCDVAVLEFLSAISCIANDCFRGFNR